jgi:hypothetical protein
MRFGIESSAQQGVTRLVLSPAGPDRVAVMDAISAFAERAILH